MYDEKQASVIEHKTESGVTRRLLRGFGAQGLSQGVQVLIRLVEIPLLLSFWGTQLYGEWLMLSAIPVYLSVGDGGFTGAACREMTMCTGAGNRKGSLAVFQSTWILLIAVSVVIFSLTVLCVELVPLASWLHFAVINDSQLKQILLILVLHILVGFQGGLINGGFWVAGRYPTGMALLAAIQVIEFVAFIFAVVSGGGPVAAAWGCLAGRFLGTGLLTFSQLRVSPWLRYGFSHFSMAELRRLTLPALGSLAFPLGNALNIQGTRLIVGLVLGPPAVALFVPLRTLSRLASQPAAVISRLIEPELAMAYGTDDLELLRQFFLRSSQLAIWGCLGAGIMVAAGGNWIFPAWTNEKVVIDWSVFLILIGGAIMNGVWQTALMIPYSTNRYGRIASMYTLVYGAAACALAYLATANLHLYGTAAALLAVDTMMVLIIVNDALQLSQTTRRSWIGMMTHPPFDMAGRAITGFRKLMIADFE